MAVFTVWRSPEGGEFPGSLTLVAGEGPPRDARDAEPEPGATLLHRFEADSHDGAMETYYALMGWAPYRPMLDERGRPYPGDSAPFGPA